MTMTLLRLAALAAASISTVIAQGPAHFGGHGGDSATSVERRVNRLALLLNLTDAQRSQATTIFTNAQTAAASVRANLTQARESLRTAVKGNQTATIDQVSTTIGTLNGQLIAIDAKADAAFYAILTPEQRTRFDLLTEGGHGRRGEGFRGL